MARRNNSLGRPWRPGRPELLAALSGVLLILAFPPFDVGWLAWIALTPLVIALHRMPLRQAFGLGYLAGAVAFGGILAWIRIFGFLPWILLSAYLALSVGAFAAATRWCATGRPAWRWVWLSALAWTGLEYLRSVGVLGFPWALLGVTQHGLLPVLQVARYAGVFGVSFLVALAGITFAGALLVRRPAPVIVPLLLLIATAGWGAAQVRVASEGTITVAAIQPNVPRAEKFAPALAAAQMRALQRLVLEAGRRGADLVVLPETAVPLNLFGPGGALVEVGRWAHQARAVVIASSLENGVSNIAVAVTLSGMAVSRYDKVRLVAFGETGILRGLRHEPLWTPLGVVGVAICFESLFPDVSRALVTGGAQVLAVITNDAWFDGTAGPAQHAAHTILRAVESGRWVVRAANTGVSMVVDPSGAVRALAPAGREAVLTARVAMVDVPTFYARRGDLFAWVGLVALLIAAAPAGAAAMSRYWTHPAFQRAGAAAGLPWGAAMLLLSAHAPWWILFTVLLGSVVALNLLRPPRPPMPFAGMRRTRAPQFAVSLVAGLVVVGVVWSVLAAAFRASQMSLPFPEPADGWIRFSIRLVLVAAALELWLRGAAFAALDEWGGQAAAVAVTTALGMSLQIGLPAEAYAWTLVTGAAFGLIRARTGNASGLVLAHAVGAALFSAIAAVR